MSLYAYFRDKNGIPLTRRGKNGKPLINSSLVSSYAVGSGNNGHSHGRETPFYGDKVIRRLIRPEWKVRSATVKKETHMIMTPRVVQEVREHFNCPVLEGAELEDQGEDGTILTHWEKRLFEVSLSSSCRFHRLIMSRHVISILRIMLILLLHLY